MYQPIINEKITHNLIFIFYTLKILFQTINSVYSMNAASWHLYRNKKVVLISENYNFKLVLWKDTVCII